MKKKNKKTIAIIPKEEPPLSGKVTDTPPLKFPKPMINIEAEFIFDPEKIKDLMRKHGIIDKLEESDNPKELPRPDESTEQP